MKQKTVLISGLIGLIFGFLFSGTLGISFFGPDEIDNTPEVEDNTVVGDGVDADVAAFEAAYNITSSIYVPISGDEYYQKLEDGDSFVLYIGRKTCPFCQQYVPTLMEAAQNQGITEIYHVDTIDPLNSMFVDDEGVNVTPTTFIVENGVVVNVTLGFKTVEDIEQILVDNIT